MPINPELIFTEYFLPEIFFSRIPVIFSVFQLPQIPVAVKVVHGTIAAQRCHEADKRSYQNESFHVENVSSINFGVAWNGSVRVMKKSYEVKTKRKIRLRENMRRSFAKHATVNASIAVKG